MAVFSANAVETRVRSSSDCVARPVSFDSEALKRPRQKVSSVRPQLSMKFSPTGWREADPGDLQGGYLVTTPCVLYELVALQQPIGIAQRPLPLAVEGYPWDRRSKCVTGSVRWRCSLGWRRRTSTALSEHVRGGNAAPNVELGSDRALHNHF